MTTEDLPHLMSYRWKKKKYFRHEITSVPPQRPKFEPVEYPEWKPQEGVRLIVVPRPSL